MRTPRQAVDEFVRNDERQSAVLLLASSFADPLDDSSRSFLGGLPFLPPELEWPTIRAKGKRAGLIFAGQIDLEDLPDFKRRDALPKTGTLYFFYKDNWEMSGGESGVMRCAVLFSKESSRRWPLRSQPEQMVAMNSEASTSPFYLDANDYRNHGHFRFNLSFAPFRSVPEQLDLSQTPLGRLSDKEAVELQEFLGAHPSTGTLGAQYVDFVGIETAWGYACEHEGLETLKTLQRDSLAQAIATRARSEWGHLPLYNPRELSSEVIFCWAIIGAFARGLLAPLPRYVRKADAGLQDARLRGQAEVWLRRAADKPPLDAPDRATAEAFLEFMRWIQGCGHKEISYDLGLRFSTLCRDVFRHAVNLASEAGALARAPADLRAELDMSPLIRRKLDDVEVNLTMHHMFGHGSYDHTAVPPSERTDKVLLLRLDCGDPMLRGSEGSYHFWIEPKRLAKGDFSKVELTC